MEIKATAIKAKDLLIFDVLLEIYIIPLDFNINTKHKGIRGIDLNDDLIPKFSKDVKHPSLPNDRHNQQLT